MFSPGVRKSHRVPRGQWKSLDQFYNHLTIGADVRYSWVKQDNGEPSVTCSVSCECVAAVMVVACGFAFQHFCSFFPIVYYEYYYYYFIRKIACLIYIFFSLTLYEHNKQIISY